MGSWCSKEKVFQGRIQEFLIGGWGVGVQTLVQKGLLSFFTANHFSPPPHTPSHQLRLYVIIPWPLTVYLNCTRNASVNSSCVQCPPPPRDTAGHLPALSVPGVGHLLILCFPVAGHLLTPRAIRKVLTRTRFRVNSYQNITTQRILLGGKADWLTCQGQEKIEEGCKGMFLILCTHFFTDYQTRIT